MRAAIIVCALGACTYPAKEFQAPFGCLEARTPAAAQSATISGRVIEAGTENNVETPPIFLPGVTITLLTDTLTPIPGSPVTSKNDGSYTVPVPLGGTAFDRVYLKAEGDGHVPSLLANTHPITNTFRQDYGFVSFASLQGVASKTILENSFPPDTTTVFVTVRDCNGDPVPNAVIRPNPVATVHYFDGQLPAPGGTETGDLGLAVINLIPTTDLTLDISVGDVNYRDHLPYKLEANGITQFDITP